MHWVTVTTHKGIKMSFQSGHNGQALRRKATLAIVGGLLVQVCLAAPAGASEAAASGQVGVNVVEDIMWVEGQTESAQGERVAIKLFAPKADGGMKLWQHCSFHFSAGATYRCGIDVATGSAASKTQGRWVAKLIVDGTVIDRAGFSAASAITVN